MQADSPRMQVQQSSLLLCFLSSSWLTSIRRPRSPVRSFPLLENRIQSMRLWPGFRATYAGRTRNRWQRKSHYFSYSANSGELGTSRGTDHSLKHLVFFNNHNYYSSSSPQELRGCYFLPLIGHHYTLRWSQNTEVNGGQQQEDGQVWDGLHCLVYFSSDQAAKIRSSSQRNCLKIFFQKIVFWQGMCLCPNFLPENQLCLDLNSFTELWGNIFATFFVSGCTERSHSHCRWAKLIQQGRKAVTARWSRWSIPTRFWCGGKGVWRHSTPNLITVYSYR